MRALSLISFLSLLSLLAASSAVADAVGPPVPRECPAGSFATTNHCGTVCGIQACTTDADCSTGRCEDRSLCMEQVPCGGWGGTYDIAHASCAPGATCAAGACQTVRTCGPAAARDAGAATDAGTRGEHVKWGCGCRAAGGSGSSGLIAVGLALALAFAFARRR